MHKLLLLLSSVVFSTIIFSQNSELENKLKLFQDKIETETSFKDKLFLDHHWSVGSEIIVFPYKESEIQLDGTQWTFDERPVTIPIANYTIEPRFNLKELNSRAVLFLKTPVGLSLSATTNSFYTRSKGFMHFQCGVFFGVGKRLNSTLNNIEQKGFAIGIGMQYLRAPLFGHKILPEYESTFSFADGTEFVSEKNWLLPSIQVDLYRINKKNKLLGNYFVFGYYKALYFKFGFTIF